MADASQGTLPATGQGFNKLAVVLLGTIGGVQVSDPIIATTSLVQASTSLGFSAAIQSLAAGISTLALAATVIPGGLMADRLGRKGILMIALLVSSVGQLITAIAPDPTVFLLGRIVAGIALGVVFGAAYGLLREVANNSLGPAMGLFNVMNLVVAMVFGFVGGSLASINWRFSFMLLPVLSILCVLALKPIIPKVPRLPGGSIDYLGMILVGIGVVGLLYGVSNAALNPAKPSCWVPILIGIVAFIGFWFVETKSKSPVFPIRLLRHPAFLAAVILGIAWNMGNGAATQMIANIWQYVQGFNTVRVSLDELIMTIAAAVGSIVAGRLLGKGRSARTLGFSGLVMLGIGFLLFLIVSPTTGLLLFVPGMLLAAFGWMMDATTQGAMFLTLAPKRFFGPVTSSKVTVGQFGYSLGLSGSSALVSLLTLAQVNQKLEAHGTSAGDNQWQAITQYLQEGKSSDAALSVISRADLAAIYTNSFKLTAILIGVLVLIAAGIFYFLMRRPRVNDSVEDYCDPDPALIAN